MANLSIKPGLIKKGRSAMAMIVLSLLEEAFVKDTNEPTSVSSLAYATGQSYEDIVAALEELVEEGAISKPDYKWDEIGSFKPVDLCVAIAYQQLALQDRRSVRATVKGWDEVGGFRAEVEQLTNNLQFKFCLDVWLLHDRDKGERVLEAVPFESAKAAWDYFDNWCEEHAGVTV